MKEMNESEPLMNCRKRRNGCQKWEESLPMISLEETCLLAKRHPALRWHDFHTGLYKELGNLFIGIKGEIQAGNTGKNQSTNTINRGGATRSSAETSVMEMERRGCIYEYSGLNNCSSRRI